MLTREDTKATLGFILPWSFSLGQNGLLPTESLNGFPEILSSGGVQSLHRVMDLKMTYMTLGVRALHGYAERGLDPNVGADSVCLPAFLTELSCSQPQHRHLRTH